MTIERNVNGAAVSLKFVGRSDASSAPPPEAPVDGCAPDIGEPILDCCRVGGRKSV